MPEKPLRPPAGSTTDPNPDRDRFPKSSFDRDFGEPALWAGLIETLRETVFPPHLPPLELTSTPISMPDRMAAKTNPWAIGAATFFNAAVLALFLLLGLRSTTGLFVDPNPGQSKPIEDFTLIAPPGLSHGGGGGGTNELSDPIQGHLPRRDAMPIVPPQNAVLQNPKIPIASAIAVPPNVTLPDNPALPNLGVQSSPNVRLDSSGPGAHAGIGGGSNGGDGPGHGPGYGPGADGGFGGNIYTPGIGGVSRPVPIVAPDAEFSDEARRQHYQGACIVSIVVDARGYPVNPQVTRSLGLGLDEKALEAVRKYRFKPATKDGKPVPSYVSVEIDFHLY